MKALGMVIFNHILSRTSRPDSGDAIALATIPMSLWMDRWKSSNPAEWTFNQRQRRTGHVQQNWGEQTVRSWTSRSRWPLFKLLCCVAGFAKTTGGWGLMQISSWWAGLGNLNKTNFVSHKLIFPNPYDKHRLRAFRCCGFCRDLCRIADELLSLRPIIAILSNVTGSQRLQQQQQPQHSNVKWSN